MNHYETYLNHIQTIESLLSTPSMTKKAHSKVMTGFTSPRVYRVIRVNVALVLSREAESLLGMLVLVSRDLLADYSQLPKVTLLLTKHVF